MGKDFFFLRLEKKVVSLHREKDVFHHASLLKGANKEPNV